MTGSSRLSNPTSEPSAQPRDHGRIRPGLIRRVSSKDLELAEVEIASLLRKCEAVVRGSSLSPSRLTLMTNRVAALQTALELVTHAQSHDAT